jgi:hypothetical protein
MADLQYPGIDAAIGQFEGFNTPGTLAARQNNPGNIIYGPFAKANGAIGQGSGNPFAIFPNIDIGMHATDNLVSFYAKQNATISDLVHGWSPETAPGNSPQSTQAYTDFVAGSLGVPASTPVSDTKQPWTIWDAIKVGTNLGNVADAADTVLATKGITPGNMAASLFGLTLGRAAAFILGLICIFSGLMMFKPVQTTVISAVKTAGTAAVAA